MIVSLKEVKNYLDFIQKVNSVPLEDIVWMDENGKDIKLTKEELEEWRFIGLSNVCYAETNLLGKIPS